MLNGKMKFDIINVEVTNVCNFTCRFCPQYIMTRKKGFISLKLAKNVIREIKELNLTRNLFFHVMGEPLLHPKLHKIVKYARKLGFKTHIFTNGFLLRDREDVIKFVDRIELSFQLLNKKEFKKTRPGVEFKEYIQRIKDGLEICSRYPVQIDFAILINPFHHLLRLKKELKIIPSSRNVNRVKSSLKRLGIPVRNVNIIFKILEPWGSAIFDGKRIYPAVVGACLGLQTHFAILWDGTVTVCCKDYNGVNRIGKLPSTTLYKVLTSSKTKRIRRLLKMNVIPPLPYCKICKGGPTIKSWIFNQLGSIFFIRLLRPFILKRRNMRKFIKD